MLDYIKTNSPVKWIIIIAVIGVVFYLFKKKQSKISEDHSVSRS